jgi:hypothetical protein
MITLLRLMWASCMHKLADDVAALQPAFNDEAIDLRPAEEARGNITHEMSTVIQEVLRISKKDGGLKQH